MGVPGPSKAQDLPEGNATEIIQLLKEQNSNLSRDLRRIQREIAALRADLDKPGLKEVFAGIGYIFGLFGVAAFVAARRKE
jgi:nickel transport protein